MTEFSKILSRICMILATLAISHPVLAKSRGGEGVGGGDQCENRIKIIRDDIKGWIMEGGPRALQLPSGMTVEDYSTAMLDQISKAKIKCVGPSDDGYPVMVEGVPKACRFDLNYWKSSITCDLSKFPTADEDAYVQVHHELAGLAGLERPVGADSKYDLSNQITGSLENRVVKKLVVRRQNESGEWKYLDGAEAARVAARLQAAITTTTFRDCEVTPRVASYSATCGGIEYPVVGLSIRPKINPGGKIYNYYPGYFYCGSNPGTPGTYLLSKAGQQPVLRDFVDRNFVTWRTDGSAKRDGSFTASYFLDETGNGIDKIAFVHTLISESNSGTIVQPATKQHVETLGSFECHADVKAK